MEVSRCADCLLTTLPSGEGVILHVQTQRYVALNPTGVCVWQALAHGPRTIEELVATVVLWFIVDVGTAHNDVVAFVTALEAEQAVTTA